MVTKEELLRTQYVEAWADVRNYDTVIWQIPAAAYLINGALFTFIAESEATGVGSIVASALLLLITPPLTLAEAKNRLFQRNRLVVCRNLATQLGKGIAHPPTTTGEVIEDPQIDRARGRLSRWLEHQSAFDALYLSMLFGHAAQLGVFVASVVRTACV